MTVGELIVVLKRIHSLPRTLLVLNVSEALLVNSDLAVYQVAAAVGIDDALYFSRIFKSRYGISPREVRNKKDR